MLLIDRADHPPLGWVQRVALAVLMTVRLACSSTWLYMGVVWAGPFAFAMAVWNVAPGVIALRYWYLALWMVAIWDFAVVVAGLMALPDYGTLHGGEMISLAAVPAALELLLSSLLILSSRSNFSSTSSAPASEAVLDPSGESGPPRQGGSGFSCFACGARVSFGVSECAACEQAFHYRRD